MTQYYSMLVVLFIIINRTFILSSRLVLAPYPCTVLSTSPLQSRLTKCVRLGRDRTCPTCPSDSQCRNTAPAGSNVTHYGNRFTGRISREAREVVDAGIRGDDADSWHGSHRRSCAGNLSAPANEGGICNLEIRYNLMLSFTKSLLSRHSCAPSLRWGSRIFIVVTTALLTENG